MGRREKQYTRQEYLKRILIHIRIEPKKFMYHVTLNQIEQVVIYKHINALYRREININEAKEIIKKKYKN